MLVGVPSSSTGRALAKHVVAAVKNQCRDHERHNRIGERRLGDQHQYSGEDDPECGDRIANHVQIRAPNVDVVLGAAMESNADPHVDDDRRQRDDNHQESTGRFRIAEALDGLESNDQGDDHERYGVGESSEDTDAVIPERHPMMRGLVRHPQRIPAQAQGGGVGQVVSGIGQQRQAVSEPPGQRFRHHERQRDGDGRGHRPGGRAGHSLAVVVSV